jgi:hypothetical protein
LIHRYKNVGEVTTSLAPSKSHCVLPLENENGLDDNESSTTMHGHGDSWEVAAFLFCVSSFLSQEVLLVVFLST